MADSLFLFSTQTLLAYRVNETYYRQRHFVWCCPFAQPTSAPHPGIVMPPSSTPMGIYRRLQEDIERQDQHSAIINQNRLGLLKGADIKLGKGVITQIQHDEIVMLVKAAQLADFKPLLYVIAFPKVKKSAVPVGVVQRAHPFSPEYIIEDLRSVHFAMIEL